MTKLKLVAALVLAVLALVVVLQNTRTVAITFLLVVVQMPLAVMILLFLLAGFAIGVLVSLIVVRRRESGAKDKRRS